MTAPGHQAWSGREPVVVELAVDPADTGPPRVAVIAGIEASDVAALVVMLTLGLAIIIRAKWIEAEARPPLERIPVLRIVFVPMYSVVGLRVFGLSFIAMAFFFLLA